MLNDELFSVHTTKEDAELAIDKILERKQRENNIAHKYVRGISAKYKKEKFWIQEVVIIEDSSSADYLEF